MVFFVSGVFLPPLKRESVSFILTPNPPTAMVQYSSPEIAIADGGQDPGSAPASTRREPSFAARGTIAVVAGRQKMAPIAHARASALGRELPFEPGFQAFVETAFIDTPPTQ